MRSTPFYRHGNSRKRLPCLECREQNIARLCTIRVLRIEKASTSSIGVEESHLLVINCFDWIIASFMFGWWRFVYLYLSFALFSSVNFPEVLLYGIPLSGLKLFGSCDQNWRGTSRGSSSFSGLPDWMVTSDRRGALLWITFWTKLLQQQEEARIGTGPVMFVETASGRSYQHGMKAVRCISRTRFIRNEVQDGDQKGLAQPR